MFRINQTRLLAHPSPHAFSVPIRRNEIERFRFRLPWALPRAIAPEPFGLKTIAHRRYQRQPEYVAEGEAGHGFGRLRRERIEIPITKRNTTTFVVAANLTGSLASHHTPASIGPAASITTSSVRREKRGMVISVQ
jgi:hypothetical protein